MPAEPSRVNVLSPVFVILQLPLADVFISWPEIVIISPVAKPWFSTVVMSIGVAFVELAILTVVFVGAMLANNVVPSKSLTALTTIFGFNSTLKLLIVTSLFSALKSAFNNSTSEVVAVLLPMTKPNLGEVVFKEAVIVPVEAASKV